MARKLFVAFCVATLSALTQTNAQQNVEVAHDPQQCPADITGYYNVSQTSKIDFKVSRDLNNNLVLQFVDSGRLLRKPTIVHGRQVPVHTVLDDGTSHLIGHSVSFCQDSAIYSKFVSNDETQFESNTSKFTLEADGIHFQQIAPTASDIKVWPRAN